jgi:hypothetical protein
VVAGNAEAASGMIVKLSSRMSVSLLAAMASMSILRTSVKHVVSITLLA